MVPENFPLPKTPVLSHRGDPMIVPIKTNIVLIHEKGKIILLRLSNQKVWIEHMFSILRLLRCHDVLLVCLRLGRSLGIVSQPSGEGLRRL